MKKFFADLISGSSDSSSKRFSALFTLLNIIILTYLAAWKSGWITPEYMFDALVLFAGGGLGLTVVEKIFNKKGAVITEEKPADPPPPPPATGDTTNV